MRKLVTFLCGVYLMVFATTTFANNITVSNVSLEGQVVVDHYCLVEFDLSWDNSWRTTSIPENWDAAWVFIKYSVAGGPWLHAKIDPAGSVQPAGCNLNFADTTGVFIYRDVEGSGTFSVSDIGIRWSYGDNGVADDASVEIKVFAIEMVYIPQGNFYLGDGASLHGFFEYPLGSNHFLVDGTTITVGLNDGDLNASGSSGPLGTIPADYPTGYNAFYCMKYETSQEQYVDFLNCLTRTQQQTRTFSDISGDSPGTKFVLSNLTTVHARNGVSCPAAGNGVTDPVIFHCNYNNNTVGNESDDGQNIPVSHITWMDHAAYADWAGLRPITESEFEKVCRGPNYPVGDEYAWATTTFENTQYNLADAGLPSEYITNLGQNIGNMLIVSTSNNLSGPGRCGIFAATSVNHTRVETGASYYGVMEMSGNMMEMAVSMLSLAGRSYTGLHGDGALNNQGDATTDYWPGINGNNSSGAANVAYSGTGVTAAGGAGERGGFWTMTADNSTISYRFMAQNNTTRIDDHNMANGIRLVHTAP